MNDIEDIIIFPIFIAVIGGTFFLVIKTLSDNRTKRKLAEMSVSEETIRALFIQRKQAPEIFTSLKWGLVIAGVGLALILVEFLPYDFMDAVSYGVVLLLGAGGLLLYYWLASNIFGPPSNDPQPMESPPEQPPEGTA